MNPQPSKKKNVLIIVAVVLIVIGLSTASAYAYYRHNQRVEAQETAQRAAQAITDKKAADAKALSTAQEGADINRLVSICDSALERYNALTAPQKAKEIKPDCTVHVQ